MNAYFRLVNFAKLFLFQPASPVTTKRAERFQSAFIFWSTQGINWINTYGGAVNVQSNGNRIL
jgi:hypothetical protein